MASLCALIQWIITYAVSGGFWHFAAVVTVVAGLSKVTTLVSVSVSAPRGGK